MRETTLSLPELGLIAGTRGALGAGIGLLVADRLSSEQRKAVGWTLVLFGALTTVPLALEVLGKGRMEPVGNGRGKRHEKGQWYDSQTQVG